MLGVQAFNDGRPQAIHAYFLDTHRIYIQSTAQEFNGSVDSCSFARPQVIQLLVNVFHTNFNAVVKAR